MKRAARELSTAVKTHICNLFDELVEHDGFGTLTIELKLLRRGQKEVILHCGKQYRYVIDFEPGALVDSEHTTKAQERERPTT